jgi:catechol 2,3-dioxygenase-like lactoylglutathione lyase family enzyme
MTITSAISQLRTTDLVESIRFYTTVVGLTLEFQYADFYAGIRAGDQLFHLKLVDQKDPSIELVDVHETAWGTRELAIKDNQGHTVYFGERR